MALSRGYRSRARARRPEVSALRDGNATTIMIDVQGQEPLTVSQVVAEDIQIQLGSVINTLKGVQKKLPLRDRLRQLRG